MVLLQIVSYPLQLQVRFICTNAGVQKPTIIEHRHWRAYFKESLQLHRTEKFQTSKHFKISCQTKIFISQNLQQPFFGHFLHFLCFSPSKRCRYNCTNQLFASSILKISCLSAFFSTLFHCSSSKFTTTTAQLPFYKCKLHFTTAQIVISCTLKYALRHCIWNSETFPKQRFIHFCNSTV